jgi:hypothetical protein
MAVTVIPGAADGRRTLLVSGDFPPRVISSFAVFGTIGGSCSWVFIPMITMPTAIG